MSQLKDVKTVRLTGQRYILLTPEQWVSFKETKCFVALVYSSYSLRASDALFLTCKMDPIYFTDNPRQDVIVCNVEERPMAGYNEVLFLINTPAQ